MKSLGYGMNIDLLMIWLHTLSKATVASYGHVKTMMAMSKVILLHKDMDHLD